MALTFQKAQRRKSRLRLGISGPSGSGKTLGALMIAKGIGGKIALIDTEHESAALYSEPMKLHDGSVFTPPEFDVLDLKPPYLPERFIEAIQAAENAGYDLCIIDSTTMEWNGTGGCLQLVDVLAKSKFGGNTWSAWSEVTPRHQAFMDALLRSKMHIIGTMRSKTETAQTESGGKKKVVKLGMKAEQREGNEYEYTTVLDLIHEGNYATASKDRTGLFGGDPKRITEGTGRMLADWLESGVEAAVEPEPEKIDWVAFEREATSAFEGAGAVELVTAWKHRATKIKAAPDDVRERLTAVKDARKAELAEVES